MTCAPRSGTAAPASPARAAPAGRRPRSDGRWTAGPAASRRHRRAGRDSLAASRARQRPRQTGAARRGVGSARGGSASAMFIAASIAKPNPPESTRSWRRPIFPKGCPLSIFGAGELDFRVRDGNGYGLSASVTRILLLDVIGCVRAHVASSGSRMGAGAEKSRSTISRQWRVVVGIRYPDSISPLTLGQKLKWSSPRPLVPLSFIRHRTSTCGLSNRWSTCGLTRSSPVGNLISRRASHLDAFSAYPCRT